MLTSQVRWNPRQTTSAPCAVWVDTADLSTISASGTSLTSIASKGTLGGTAVVSAGTPNYGTGTNIDGRKCITINSGDALVIPSLTFASTAKTVFSIFRVTNIPASGIRLVGTIGVTNQGGYMDCTVDVSGANYLYSLAKNGSGTRVRATSGTFNQLNTVYAFGIRGMNTTFNKVSVNFINQTPLTINMNDTFSTALARNYLIGASTFVVTWDFAETIVFDGNLSDAEYEKVEGYLSWKWGIALPAGHPYENYPPTV